MCVYVCSRERPLRLFEVLARNSQSAVELFGRARRSREQPPRMCTIPPRQRLSSPRRLVVRRWRVARGRIRIRIRIRIITRVLKPPHPCNTKERKERHAKHSKLFLTERSPKYFLRFLRRKNLKNEPQKGISFELLLLLSRGE